MNISTQLTHLDDRLAVCTVTFQDEGKRISIYASALSAESGLYPDLAQKRAAELALRLHEKGAGVFREQEISAPPLSVRAHSPVVPAVLEQDPVYLEAANLEEEPTSTNTIPDDVENAPW